MPGAFQTNRPGVPAMGLNSIRGLFDGGGPVYEYPYAIRGVTKDSAGAVLGNCVVQLFKTDDDAFLGQTTSDANGAYVLYASPTIQHYLVAYLAGSPDVSGTTVNTVVGA
jgi:hypothetical protein